MTSEIYEQIIKNKRNFLIFYRMTYTQYKSDMLVHMKKFIKLANKLSLEFLWAGSEKQKYTTNSSKNCFPNN